MSDDHVYRVIEITGSSPEEHRRCDPGRRGARLEDAAPAAVVRGSPDPRPSRRGQDPALSGDAEDRLHDRRRRHHAIVRWREPIWRCGPRCPPANASASTGGTKPTICPGRCAPSRRGARGAAGAAATLVCMSRSTSSNSVAAAEAATAAGQDRPARRRFRPGLGRSRDAPPGDPRCCSGDRAVASGKIGTRCEGVPKGPLTPPLA